MGCEIRLSEPLLKLRPVRDMKMVLLHEMIHAHNMTLRIPDPDPGGHGPPFVELMNRINTSTVPDHQRPPGGYRITTTHSMIGEVELYQTHWWECERCKKLIKRAMNRPPQEADCSGRTGARGAACRDPNCGYHTHLRGCGGAFIKIREPPPKPKASRKTSPTRKPQQQQQPRQQQHKPPLPLPRGQQRLDGILGRGAKRRAEEEEALPKAAGGSDGGGDGSSRAASQTPAPSPGLGGAAAAGGGSDGGSGAAGSGPASGASTSSASSAGAAATDQPSSGHSPQQQQSWPPLPGRRLPKPAPEPGGTTATGAAGSGAAAAAAAEPGPATAVTTGTAGGEGGPCTGGGSGGDDDGTPSAEELRRRCAEAALARFGGGQARQQNQQQQGQPSMPPPPPPLQQQQQQQPPALPGRSAGWQVPEGTLSTSAPSAVAAAGTGPLRGAGPRVDAGGKAPTGLGTTRGTAGGADGGGIGGAARDEGPRGPYCREAQQGGVDEGMARIIHAVLDSSDDEDEAAAEPPQRPPQPQPQQRRGTVVWPPQAATGVRSAAGRGGEATPAGFGAGVSLAGRAAGGGSRGAPGRTPAGPLASAAVEVVDLCDDDD
ncbi:hypothetical protein PLESTB_001750100 [Pleodorina starrii]|uniref:SprT-like domain-containing protein n=1 Tax=Pleodorina starrii TaxID=330485 RepID=A0A9W6C003_9CHLO|nr:hypothetical protein PLESTB_001750100 [Pleodorina starrii]